MQITVLTIGSEGDVRPYAVLAAALARAGNQVVFGAPPDFADIVQHPNVRFHALGASTRVLLEEQASAKFIESGRTTRAFFGPLWRRLQKRHTRITYDAWQASHDAEIVVFNSGVAAGATISEALDVPAVDITIYPMTPTRAFPPPLAGHVGDWGGISNLVLGELLEMGIGSLGRPGVVALRRELGLRKASRASRRGVFTLHAFSPHVVPKPRDWPDHFHLVGYFFDADPPDWSPPHGLSEFLQDGPPPLCIGFGSMPHTDPERWSVTVSQAVRDAGVRAVVLEGYGLRVVPELENDDIFRIERAPHSWLWPRSRGVVHHGGSGATAAAIRAGVPALVVPHNFDQPFWGRRVAALGVGPAPLPMRELDRPSLARRLRRLVDDAEMQRRARDLGRLVRAEDGVQAAIGWIYRAAEQHRRGRATRTSTGRSPRFGRASSSGAVA